MILHLDPDCVFLAPVSLLVTRGRPTAQYVWYLDQVETYGDLIRRHCLQPALMQPVGIPTVIHRDDLAQLAPRWLAKTEHLRADPEAVAAWGWVCETWAYCLAAAELGLRHDVRGIWRISRMRTRPANPSSTTATPCKRPTAAGSGTNGTTDPGILSPPPRRAYRPQAVPWWPPSMRWPQPIPSAWLSNRHRHDLDAEAPPGGPHQLPPTQQPTPA